MAISQELSEILADYEQNPSAVVYAAVMRQLDTENERRHAATLAAISDLRAYVEKIEQEANDMMGAMNDPDAMMKMAGKFLGGMG